MKLFLNRHGAVWVLLLLATGVTAWITGIEIGRNWATSTIILVAAIKIALVMAYFMELDSAPIAWQCAFGGWLIMVTTSLIISFNMV